MLKAGANIDTLRVWLEVSNNNDNDNDNDNSYTSVEMDTCTAKLLADQILNSIKLLDERDERHRIAEESGTLHDEIGIKIKDKSK